MGVNIDIHIYDKKELVEGLKNWGANNEQLLNKILDACGKFTTIEYIVLHNEYYSDGNPYFNLSSLLDSAFNKKDSFDVLCCKVKSKRGVNFVDEYEVAEELGFEINEED